MRERGEPAAGPAGLAIAGDRRAPCASPARLLWFALAESSLVALVGGAAGVLLAVLGVQASVSLWPAGLPRADAIRVDGPVLTFALALSVALAVVCAVGPALRGLGYTLAAGLRPAGTTSSRRGRRLRSALVVTQLAASVVLLVGAALLGRSLVRLLHSGIGVKTANVVVADVSLGLDRITTPGERIETVDRVLQSVRRIPGVLHAGVTTSLPLYGARLRYTLTDVSTGAGPARDYDVDALATTPELFSTLGVPLVEGRLFTDADTGTSQPVMITSARTARRFFGDRDPIGRVLSLPTSGRPGGHSEVTVVGVVGDIKYNALDAPADGGIYRPFRQQPWPYLYLVAQTASEPAAVAGAVRRSVAGVDPLIAVDDVRTLDDVLAGAAAEPRFRTVLLGALAVLALAVASIGLYGAVAYSVSLRTTEVGIRVALGASRTDVTGMVVREGVALACLGLAVGLSSALALERVLQRFLYGVTPHDAASFLAAPVGLLLLAVLASYVPARRAASVDPIAALRRE